MSVQVKFFPKTFVASAVFFPFCLSAEAQVPTPSSPSSPFSQGLLDRRPYYRPEQVRFMDRAFEEASARGGWPVQQLKKDYSPVLIELPNMVCVGLVDGGFGGPNFTACFDSKSERVVLTHLW
jgi:hypothetical protein